LPAPIAMISVGLRALQDDLVDDLGQLIGAQEAEFLAELELLVVGDILPFI
jgi:hypothetical protein